MALFFRSLFLLFLLLFLSAGTGLLLKRTEPNCLIDVFPLGVCFLLASFQIPAIVWEFNAWPLHRLSAIWIITMTVLSIAGFRTIRSRKASVFAVFHFPTVSQKILLALVLFLIGLQAFLSTYYMHPDADDATFVATAVTSWTMNSIEQFEALTGLPVISLAANLRAFSLWPVFWAMLAQITGIHPAIVMHTLLPVFFIPLSYLVFFLIARVFFNNDNPKALQLLLALTLLRFFGYTSVFTQSSFLLLRIWQGKSVFYTILIPLAFLQLLHLNAAYDDHHFSENWYLLLLISLAGTCASAMSFILFPLLLFAYQIPYILIHKSWHRIGKLFLCCTPCIVFSVWHYLL